MRRLLDASLFYNNFGHFGDNTEKDHLIGGKQMEHFPIIHTNFWDAVIAVPAVLIVTQLIKLLLPIPRFYIPTVATILGLFFAFFIAHRFNFWGAVFMGLFYGNAAVGLYAAMKTAIITFRTSRKKSDGKT